MTWMNRNFRKFMIAGIVLIALIFVLPYIWPVNPQWYFSNLNWMIPLVIIIFIAPIVPFILSSWDIHFSFRDIGTDLIVIISNYGNIPFNFNRIQFASAKKYGLVGKREFHPYYGIYDNDVEILQAETTFWKLDEHMGCTLKKGLPITLVVRGPQVPENLRHFQKNCEVYLSLYYEGTKQRVYSQCIPPEIVMKIIQNSK